VIACKVKNSDRNMLCLSVAIAACRTFCCYLFICLLFVQVECCYEAKLANQHLPIELNGNNLSIAKVYSDPKYQPVVVMRKLANTWYLLM